MTRFFTLTVLSAAVALPAIPGRAEPVTIFLKNSVTMEVDMVRFRQGQIDWRVDANAAEIRSVPLSRVAWVDFQRSSDWERAESAYRSGNFAEAVRLFQAIAANRQAHHHPVPGNLSTLARLRLLDCHRRLLDAEGVATQWKTLESERDLLPPDDRQLPSLAAAWTALAAGDGEKALELAREPSDSPLEADYLQGRALQELGRKDEALQSYTRAYTFGFGTLPSLPRDALRRSILLIDAMGNDQRLPEIHAQLSIYRDLYGDGALWDGAPAHLVELAQKELDILASSVEPPSPGPSGETGNPQPEKSAPAAGKGKPPPSPKGKPEDEAAPKAAPKGAPKA